MKDRRWVMDSYFPCDSERITIDFHKISRVSEIPNIEKGKDREKKEVRREGEKILSFICSSRAIVRSISPIHLMREGDYGLKISRFFLI